MRKNRTAISPPSLDARSLESSPFDDLASALAIEGWQQPVWDIFVDTLAATTVDLAAVSELDDASSTGCPPMLPDALKGRMVSLARQRKATSELAGVVELLYRALTPLQQVHADRLLAPLCIPTGGPLAGSGRSPAR